MVSALGNNGRRFRGRQYPNSSLRDAKLANQDWIKDHARGLSAKDGAELTGLSPKAFENLRQGNNKISFDNLVEWCRNDPQFRASFFHHCGGYLEIDPEMVAGITRVLNDAARRLHGSGK